MDPEAVCPWPQACWLSLESLLLTGWQGQKRVSHNKLMSIFFSALSCYYDELRCNDAKGASQPRSQGLSYRLDGWETLGTRLGASLPNGTIGYFYIAITKLLTGRFHVLVLLFSDRSQMTSKYKTCSATLGHRLIYCFVLYSRETRKVVNDIICTSALQQIISKKQKKWE